MQVAEIPSQGGANSEQSVFEQFGQNSGFVRELYQLYLQDPSSVGAEWETFFSNLGLPLSNGTSNGTPSPTTTRSAGTSELAVQLSALTRAYQERGHLRAKINPLTAGVQSLPYSPELTPEYYGLNSETASSLLRELESKYCGSIGFEYTHLLSVEAKNFIQSRIDARVREQPSAEIKRRIFEKLICSEELEAELHRKFVGQKRFSVQGAETLIPMLDRLAAAGARNDVREIVIGMAHRGRVNVLANITGKPLERLFNEFEDQTVATLQGDGDVKYHLGWSGSYETESGSVLTTLLPNPSHLEFVNCVVVGATRAKQDVEQAENRGAVVPVQIHGDAAFAGQGVVFETLNLSAMPSYTTGGSIHIVINNQVGFTTNAVESRSSIYCTDMAKAVEAPVFHVNAEDPEAACWVAELALEFRRRFARDVVIDLYCYRKYGHNEGDDPTFTQPQMYAEIQAKKSIATMYGEALTSTNVLSEDERSAIKKRYLESFAAAESRKKAATAPLAEAESGATIVSSVGPERLREIAELLIKAPEGFHIHPKLLKILEKRVETMRAGQGIDWGLAEGLAFGSLLQDGVSVRLSGQDCGRGTFSHRHLLLTDHERLEHYPVLEPLTSEKVRFDIINSTLSETAVLGFEFGYSAIASGALVMWEAQFGDFSNGAQIIIDQFISSSETKWGQRSGVVLLLPHGFEGQGPEHSSARLERYLQLCAQNNMMVAYPTKSAQHFHLLRRQGLAPVKRPLVVMTPKSLLRSTSANGQLSDFTEGTWQPIIVDDIGAKPTEKLILCSGKVVYDLLAHLEKSKTSARVIRLEQLYPFPREELAAALKGCKGKKVTWCQEEPANMGAFGYVRPLLEELGLSVRFAGRKAAASPATGSSKRSAAEQSELLTSACD